MSVATLPGGHRTSYYLRVCDLAPCEVDRWRGSRQAQWINKQNKKEKIRKKENEKMEERLIHMKSVIHDKFHPKTENIIDTNLRTASASLSSPSCTSQPNSSSPHPPPPPTSSTFSPKSNKYQQRTRSQRKHGKSMR